MAEGVTIYTAGYGNRGFEGFVALVKSYGVTHLVDVRSVPQSSYWQDFRRVNLMELVPKAGLRYVYMGDTLGGVEDSPALCQEPESVELEPLFASPKLALGIEKLLQAARDPAKVICLMCGCKRPHACHRSRLLGATLLKLGVDLWHITDDDRLIPQSALAVKAFPFQAELF